MGGCCQQFPQPQWRVNTFTLAARGLEEPLNSQELLIESVGPVSLFCVCCHIVPICCFSLELKSITYALTYAHRNIHSSTLNFTYGEVTVFLSTDSQTDSRTDRRTDELIWGGLESHNRILVRKNRSSFSTTNCTKSIANFNSKSYLRNNIRV